MNNQYNCPNRTERHLRLWIYLLPVVGVIPAIWTLYLSPRNKEIPSEKKDALHIHSSARCDRAHREQQKVSRLSVTLILAWLSSYSLLSLGAANASGIMSFRLLYTNAILTTGYFLACTVLMSRLSKKSLPLADRD